MPLPSHPLPWPPPLFPAEPSPSASSSSHPGDRGEAAAVSKERGERERTVCGSEHGRERVCGGVTCSGEFKEGSCSMVCLYEWVGEKKDAGSRGSATPVVWVSTLTPTFAKSWIHPWCWVLALRSFSMSCPCPVHPHPLAHSKPRSVPVRLP